MQLSICNFKNAKDKRLKFARIMTESLTDFNSQRNETCKFNEQTEKQNI